jgi:NAD(P)H-nitrite reductase large subunit
MAQKIILCRCEDVTLGDIEKAVRTGFSELEEVKRYTGFGTGPCQGKECLREIALAIARATRRPPEEMTPFTSRPPLTPTELRLYAGAHASRPPGQK